jgi:two-component system response regulator RegA
MTTEIVAPAISILIVDVDEVLRKRLARAFDERGYDVRMAADYNEAIAAAQSESPELAILDLRMPGRSGLELVQALRKLDPATKIVVLTGYGSIATAVDAIRLGATYYLPKPADVDDILTAFSRGERPALDPPLTPHSVPSLARAEWEHISRVLSDCGNNISEAARRLAIHRRSLQRKLQKYPPNE